MICGLKRREPRASGDGMEWEGAGTRGRDNEPVNTSVTACPVPLLVPRRCFADIDFGHFLGNFKTKKLGIVKIKRERTPFVFTPQVGCRAAACARVVCVAQRRPCRFASVRVCQMAHVMKEGDGKLFDEFVELCKSAFNGVREYGDVLITHFIAMLAAGLPELESEQDIHYLRNMLALHVRVAACRCVARQCFVVCVSPTPVPRAADGPDTRGRRVRSQDRRGTRGRVSRAG